MTPQQVIEATLATASARGTEVVAIVDEVASAQLRWARNAFTTNGVVGERRLTVVALGAGRTPGVATVSGAVDGAAVSALVAAADRARGREVAGGPDLPPPVTAVDPDGWHRPPSTGADAGLPDFAGRLAASFSAASAAGHLLHGYAEQRSRTTYLASSAGLRRRHDQSSALLDYTVRSGDEPATWSGACARELSELDLDAEHGAARERLGWWRRRRQLPSGEYEVLLAPSCVADLMLPLYRAADVRAALAGRSAFAAPGGATRIGERLSAAPLTLHSDPHEPGLECAPFTVARGSGTASVYDNGLSLARTNWITDGVLTALVGSREIAVRTGGPATPEIGNLVLSGAGSGPSLAELVARTTRGLLLTSLWYLRELDPRSLLLSGLTRDGVYLVEEGQIRGAVNPFRFNASPLDVLARAREVGRTEPTLPREYDEHTTRVAMPSLRVADFALSAVTHAG